MRILSVHNTYQIRGGEDESRESEERLLREKGHQVDTYEENNDRTANSNKIQLALQTIWSSKAYNEILDQFNRSSYSLVHIQNFFPLISPAVHYAAKSKGIPVVQTLRNYRLLCPNALFFREGNVCEDCMGKPIPYPGIIHRCYRNDLAASTVTAAMITVHRALQTWDKQVDCFITLTDFSRNKFIEGGFPSEKIFVKPNFVYPDPGVGHGKGGYALFVGRLSVEKGLDTLLEAWPLLEHSYPLKIVGDGPWAPYVESLAAQYSHIQWLGRRPMAEVHELMGNATFLIFTSKWYETFGRVAVEAFAKGTPVVAANIGAIAELVKDQYTGLLFSPGNAVDLAAKISWMLVHPKTVAEMRQNARAEFEAKYTASANYQRLMEIYSMVI
ncbi:MAG: glycosyltransferase family 4 protein [Prochlorotrichaceae cyanobacterium]|jgi:glycosyltransferase involved in cell wall biosynthesis